MDTCRLCCKQPHLQTCKKPNICDEIIPPHQKIVMEGAEKHLIHLPGFFKEQLNVEFCNNGKITVSGQRRLFDNWWSRFRKELRAPEDCNINDMCVSFKDEVLSIVLPNLTCKTKAIVQDEPTHDASKKEGATSTPEPKCSSRKQLKGKDQPEEGEKGTDAAARATRHGAGIRLRKMKLKMDRLEDELFNSRKLMVAFIVATVVSVGMGLCFHCRLTSTGRYTYPAY